MTNDSRVYLARQEAKRLGSAMTSNMWAHIVVDLIILAIMASSGAPTGWMIAVAVPLSIYAVVGTLSSATERIDIRCSYIEQVLHDIEERQPST